eukprot:3470559-Prymnesium_polylepis.1
MPHWEATECTSANSIRDVPVRHSGTGCSPTPSLISPIQRARGWTCLSRQPTLVWNDGSGWPRPTLGWRGVER